MALSVGPDSYTRIARVRPALIVILPAALAVLAWFPDARLGAVWAVVVASGGTYLLAQVARARGKLKEPELFERFGGHPTIRRLKQLDTPNSVSLERWRRRIQELLPGVSLPTPEQERDDPSGANDVYLSIAQFLIERTRDRAKYGLLFQENCQYGFARNLWAMKPVGICITLASLASVALLGYSQYRNTAIATLTIAAAAAAGILLYAWVFWITPRWVQVPSDAYADRLLAALDSL